MAAAGSHKLIITVPLLWLIWITCCCCCSSSSDHDHHQMMSRETTTVVIPTEEGLVACSPNAIANGDPIAGAIAELAYELLNAAPIIARNPTRQSCFFATNEDARAYGAVSCNFHDTLNCKNCLEEALQGLSDECPDKDGAQIVLQHCFMRFEAYEFCNPPVF